MRPTLLALPLVLVVTGCSGSSAPQPAPSPTAVAGTPAPTATSTRVAPARDGDVDGDGTLDAVSTTATLVTVVLSSTGRSVTAPIHAESPAKAPLLGGFDIDRDGYSEVFLETAQGASTTFTTPYRFDGTTLRELQLDGMPLRLGIGGSVAHGDGFRCTPDGLLEVRAAESSDGQTYTVTSASYRIGAGALALVRRGTEQADQGASSVEQSYTAGCGTVGDG